MTPDSSTQPTTNKRAWALLALHVLLFVYSFTSFFSKNAAQHQFPSLPFIGFYFGMLVVLGIYAIGWQQIIKYLPLSLAFANKAVTVAWGMMWGVVFFGEQLTPLMILGASIVMAGVVLFSYADAHEQPADQDAASQAVDEP